MQSTRFEIEQEIKAREKIIAQCQSFISDNEVKIRLKWLEIKDFIDGNSAERVEQGASLIKQWQGEIKAKNTEIRRKEDQIANYRVMLSFRGR